MSHKRKSCSEQEYPVPKIVRRSSPLIDCPGSSIMATSQNMHSEALFHISQPPVQGIGSPTASGFLHEDVHFDLPRTDVSGADLEPIFGVSTQEWVSAQSALLPTSGGIMSGDPSFIHGQEVLNLDAWTGVNEPHGSMTMWHVTSNVAPSISEFTQLTDTISDSSSPVTSASVGEIEGSCSPELMAPPLAMVPSVFDPIAPHGSLPEFEHWNIGPSSFVEVKPSPFNPVDVPTPVVLRPSLEHAGRRHSNDSDPQKARSDVRYGYLPQEDGLYHCPFMGCLHAPDKLKCNYDKHLDSHLKPYRCKMKACQDTAFSSTACVLRHEREAHGMHGHGNKPFTCVFPQCDRSNPDNGFPRRWNLHDHMRRMHNYTPKAGADETPETHTAGPARTKRGSRTSPKPKAAKDETIKATTSRKNSSRSIPKTWLDQQAVCAPPANYEISYTPTVDVSQVSPASIYAPWNGNV